MLLQGEGMTFSLNLENIMSQFTWIKDRTEYCKLMTYFCQEIAEVKNMTPTERSPLKAIQDYYAKMLAYKQDLILLADERKY